MKQIYILVLGLFFVPGISGQTTSSITMRTGKAVGSAFSLSLTTNANNTLIQVDFGSGTMQNFTVESSGTTINGTVGTSRIIKIYGTGIIVLDCSLRQIKELDVTNCSELKELYCFGNQITILDLKNNIALESLACQNNQIAALDLTNKSGLYSLYCNLNKLAALDISKNKELIDLACEDNQIATLDVSNNIKLEILSCERNRFTFATLPVPQSTWTYQYAPQQAISIEKNYKTGIPIDLSNQSLVGGKSTVYIWKTKAGTPLVEGTDYTIENGKSTFLQTQPDSVYCEMTNATFPMFKQSNGLKTTCSKVSIAGKQAQTITFNSLPAKKVDDAPFTLSATTTSNLEIAYTSSDASIASITGNTVTIHKAGTITITASQSGNSNWEAASATQTLTITAAAATKKAQTITFDPIPAKKVGDATFDLKATASSSLDVTFVSDNSAIASVSGSKVTILKAGTVNITASQGGNGEWNAAESVTQTLTISKKTQTINFEAIPAKKIKDAPFTLKASSSSNLPITYTSSDPLVASVTGSTITILKAGTVTFTATQAGSEEWEPISASQKLTISATTGIKDEKEDMLSIYPNPVTENLYIKDKEFENTNASIFNALGANVWSGKVAGQSINVSQLPAGIYLLRLGNKYEVKTIRFEKQ